MQKCLQYYHNVAQLRIPHIVLIEMQCPALRGFLDMSVISISERFSVGGTWRWHLVLPQWRLQQGVLSWSKLSNIIASEKFLCKRALLHVCDNMRANSSSSCPRFLGKGLLEDASPVLLSSNNLCKRLCIEIKHKTLQSICSRYPVVVVFHQKKKL